MYTTIIVYTTNWLEIMYNCVRCARQYVLFFETVSLSISQM